MSTPAVIDLGVYPVIGEPGRYHVRSSGNRGHAEILYLVDLEYCTDDREDSVSYGCGCRDFEVRSGMLLYPAPDCKHLRAAKSYQKLQRCFGGARP